MFELTPYFRNNRKTAQVYDPFREMEDMERRFFGNSVGSFRSDIKDEGDAYLIETDMPGFRKEDIRAIRSLSAPKDTAITRRTIRRSHICTLSVPTAHMRDRLTFPASSSMPSA